ncbi:MAG: HAD domain-containing protein [Polyangiales bacterium]
MRVLFLDIDGVLNTRSYVQSAGWAAPLGSDRDLQIIDPAAVGLLNLVVEETGALVVISSSWRITYELPQLDSMLKQRGFDGRVLGATPQLPGRRRCMEIGEWLADNRRVDAFAIVDDDEDAGVEHARNFVQTSFEEGLTRDHVETLVRILQSK